MKNFVKSNLYYIIRLIGTQVGISIFAMMLQFATISISQGLHLVASIGAIVFYMALIYSTSWEMGYKVSERISAGRLTRSPLHGAYVACAAYAPVFFLLILLWVGFSFGSLLWGGNLFYIAKTALLGKCLRNITNQYLFIFICKTTTRRYSSICMNK